MTTPDVSRKVRQLDNDVQAIYEMLGRIETSQTQQGARLDAIDGKLTQLETAQNAMQATQNTIQATQARQGNRLDEMDNKLDRLIDLLEQR